MNNRTMVLKQGRLQVPWRLEFEDTWVKDLLSNENFPNPDLLEPKKLKKKKSFIFNIKRLPKSTE
jgi:hypothetical protein